MHCHSMEIWEYTIGVYANLSALFAYRLISVGAGFIEVPRARLYTCTIAILHALHSVTFIIAYHYVSVLQ